MNREEGIRYIKENLKVLPCTPDDAQSEKLYDWYIYLTDKNKEFNLTAITDFAEVVEKHYYDSLLFCPDPETRRIIDVGTGAGFPGMPLAILHPEISFVLMDSLAKRVAFLEESAALLGLKNVKAVHARAEDLGRDPEYRESFDVCVSRAVSQLRILAEYCIPFVRTGGCFVPYKAGNCGEELEEAGKALSVLGVTLEGSQEEALPESGASRRLLFFRKVHSTPAKYPRKAGTPSKKPL